MVARGCAWLWGCAWLQWEWGACVVGGDVHGRGGVHGFQGVCMVAGGMHGCWGACVVAGVWLWLCAWLEGGMLGCWGAYMVAGGHVWLLGGMHGCRGVCMVAGGGKPGCQGGMHGCWGRCIGYDKIRSMSGRYASYWFLILVDGWNLLMILCHSMYAG